MERKFKYTDIEHSFMAGRYLPMMIRETFNMAQHYDLIGLMDDLDVVFGYLDKYKFGFDHEYIEELYDALFFISSLELWKRNMYFRRLLNEYIDPMDIHKENIKFSKTKVKRLEEFKNRLIKEFFNYIFEDAKKCISVLYHGGHAGLLNDKPYYMVKKDDMKEYDRIMGEVNKLLDECQENRFNCCWCDHQFHKFNKFLRDRIIYKFLTQHEFHDISLTFLKDRPSSLEKVKEIFGKILSNHPEYIWMLNYYMRYGRE